MGDEALAGDVRDFILRHIDSVTQLEALLLLRSTPETRWPVSMAAQRLYTAEADVSDALGQLAESGFLVSDNSGYRFECATPELGAEVDRLAEAYSRQLIPVTNLIHSKPRRIRKFADAFKFRKDR